MLPEVKATRHKIDLGRTFKSLINASDCTIDTAPAHQLRLWLNKIKIELKRERNRGKLRHYRYNMNRHIALAAAHKELTARLDQLNMQ